MSRADRPGPLSTAGVSVTAHRFEVAAPESSPGQSSSLQLASGLATLAPSIWQLTGWLVVGVGILSGLTQLIVLPNAVLAWNTGAEGETRTAEFLASLEPAGFVVLHDRLMPASRANIDHVVVGPTGVFVIETRTTQVDFEFAPVRCSWTVGGGPRSSTR